MIQKCIFVISASALLVACKADCPDKVDQKNNEESILTLANSSDALKELIKSKDSSSEEKNNLAEEIFNEISIYFDGKYGSYVNTEDYKYIWNEADTLNKTLTVFTLDYEFPDKEFSLIPNEPGDGNDTIFHGMTVLLKIKNI